MSKKKPMKVPGQQYVRAPGAPFGEEDATLVGTELKKIADAHRVGDVRSLDKSTVFEAIEADPNHPLRKLYDWDVTKAARAQWIERTGQIIRGIRVVSLPIRKHEKPTPMFIYVPRADRDRINDKIGTRPRSRVLTEDLIASDPDFASALSGQIKIVRDAVNRYAHIVSMRGSPRAYEDLSSALRRAIEEFDVATHDAAAE